MICPSCGNEIPDDSKSCFICGEELKKAASYGRSPYGAMPAGNSYYQDRDVFPNAPMPQPQRQTDKKAVAIIFGGIIALLIFATVIFLYRTGFFINKDGVYRSDDLKEAFNKMMANEGYGNDPMLNRIDYDCTLTIEGSKVTMHLGATMDGVSIYDRSMEGKISFFGTHATLSYNGRRGESVDYDPVNQTISFNIEDSDAAAIGLDRFTFKKVE
jgi:hypothetical protein